MKYLILFGRNCARKTHIVPVRREVQVRVVDIVQPVAPVGKDIAVVVSVVVVDRGRVEPVPLSLHHVRGKQLGDDGVDAFQDLPQPEVRVLGRHPRLCDQPVDFVQDQDRGYAFTPGLKNRKTLCCDIIGAKMVSHLVRIGYFGIVDKRTICNIK